MMPPWSIFPHPKPERISSKHMKKSTTAVASLKRLSHSRIRRNLFGSPIFFAMDSTATGSVAEIIIANNIRISRGTVIHNAVVTRYDPPPIRVAESMSHTIANIRIGR